MAYFLAKDTVLWLEDFEGGFPGSMATYKLGDQSSGGWQEYTSSTGWGHVAPMGAISAGHNDDNVGDMCDDWLVSPAIELPAEGIISFTFYHATYYAPDYTHYRGVWVSTGSGDPSDGDFVELLDLSSAGTHGSWKKLRLDLSAYAGETIYIAFRYQGDYSDEWYLDSMRVSLMTKDLAVSIVGLNGSVEPDSELVPQLKLENLGLSEASDFSVVFNIYSSSSLVYSDTQTVSSLPSGDSITLSFSSFTPSPGPYTAEAYHTWADDECSNDTARSDFYAVQRLYTAHVASSNLTIDGALDDPAWQEADTLDISDFLGYSDEPDTLGTAFMLAVHNFDTLFLGLVAATASTNNSVGLTFDDNDDGQWPEDDTTEGHNLITPLQWGYQYMTQGGGGSWTTLDPSPPFAVSYSAGQIRVEVAIPIVHDPAEDAGPWTLLSTVAQGSGDTVGFQIYYIDDGKIKGWWPQDAEDGLGEDPAYFGDLILEGEMTAGERAGAEAPSLQVLGVRRPFISLNLPSAASVRVEVYDVSGRIVKTLLDGRAKAGLHKLSVGQLKPGVYSVLARVGGKAYRVKFVAR